MDKDLKWEKLGIIRGEDDGVCLSTHAMRLKIEGGYLYTIRNWLEKGGEDHFVSDTVFVPNPNPPTNNSKLQSSSDQDGDK